MTPQPIGASAYGIDPQQFHTTRRSDLASFQQDITRALNADEAAALNASFGVTDRPIVTRPRTQPTATLGRHIDVRA